MLFYLEKIGKTCASTRWCMSSVKMSIYFSKELIYGKTLDLGSMENDCILLLKIHIFN